MIWPDRVTARGRPSFPSPDKAGNVPALEFARVSIARDVIRARRAAGLSQQALADLAGLRQETLSRIETARRSASPATIAKIQRAIERASKPGTVAGAPRRKSPRPGGGRVG